MAKFKDTDKETDQGTDKSASDLLKSTLDFTNQEITRLGEEQAAAAKRQETAEVLAKQIIILRNEIVELFRVTIYNKTTQITTQVDKLTNKLDKVNTSKAAEVTETLDLIKKIALQTKKDLSPSVINVDRITSKAHALSKMKGLSEKDISTLDGVLEGLSQEKIKLGDAIQFRVPMQKVIQSYIGYITDNLDNIENGTPWTAAPGGLPDNLVAAITLYGIEHDDLLPESTSTEYTSSDSTSTTGGVTTTGSSAPEADTVD